MKQLFLGAFFIISFLYLPTEVRAYTFQNTLIAQYIPTTTEETLLPVTEVTFATSTQPVPVNVLISHYSELYGVSSTSMYRTIQCESAGFHNGQSGIPHKGGPNGKEDSWGYVQIHLPSHPEITKAEALDPDFAIEWMAQQFSQGNQRLWTCARMLGYA